ncbi:inactive serine/threonine-protein kinase PLK5-like isoform X2 [Ahaetulla prasina]|uniref:inactive serine/threonine-protein kinase PLK5-like isoform X2 n=1 Tax=Ahaetulla prasina TaxID=499056 RepID=UPI002648846B|nr:inactive serine/threonine-protein kinase PLK5-like isoform X2 [Ahaetulla prasina]
MLRTGQTLGEQLEGGTARGARGRGAEAGMGLTADARRRAEGDTLKYFVEDPGTGTLYKRGQLLGQGAFGQCYKFTDTSTNRVYAVKVLPQQRVTRLGNRGKVQREIELHSQLHHRNIVGFHQHFADQENIYLVLEYCSRKVRRTLTEPEVRFYLKQITSGLQYLHQQGIIHRDLKLSNVFITECMQVKIGDLGLATREDRACPKRGVVCGTPNYLAPEVIAKKGHSFKSDIWALGCIMYTALAGFPPFEITHKQKLFQRIREGCYPLPGHFSPAARSLIGRLLAPDPSGRPSLEEVLGHPFFTQHFIPARLPSRASRSAPIFPFANPLGKFFQKAAMLLFRGTPRQDPQAVSPAPQEQEEMPQLQEEGPVAPLHLILKKEAKEGSIDPMEEPSCLSPQLLRRGSLRSRLPEDAAWGPSKVLGSVDRRLCRCLQMTPLVKELPEGLCSARPAHMATKWVDYSNKYGFGYLLSDGSTAVLLPDGTHMAFCPQHQRICYCSEVEKSVSFGWREVPLCLATKRRVLHFFTQYMQRWLQEGGPCQTSPSRPLRALSLLHFAKSDKALLMLFSDGTLQVNFYHDRTKIVLSRSAEGVDLLTFVDCQHCSTTFPLGTLARQGWTLPLREQVQYALHLLHCL